MRDRFGQAVLALVLTIAQVQSAQADWVFNRSPTPNAATQTGNTTLELRCDRLRFAPAAYADAQDIERKQGLALRFMADGATEVASFQAGAANATVLIVDNYPVELEFRDRADYDFVLEQIAGNAALNLAMIDEDVSYGIFDLQGSATAIASLRAACTSGAGGATAGTVPEGIRYCGGEGVKRQIEYAILKDPQDQWDATVTVNGDTIRAMTSFSYFGQAQPPRGFVVALLGEDRSEFLVFREGDKDWLEYGDYTYRQCN